MDRDRLDAHFAAGGEYAARSSPRVGDQVALQMAIGCPQPMVNSGWSYSTGWLFFDMHGLERTGGGRGDRVHHLHRLDFSFTAEPTLAKLGAPARQQDRRCRPSPPRRRRSCRRRGQLRRLARRPRAAATGAGKWGGRERLAPRRRSRATRTLRRCPDFDFGKLRAVEQFRERDEGRIDADAVLCAYSLRRVAVVAALHRVP